MRCRRSRLPKRRNADGCRQGSASRSTQMRSVMSVKPAVLLSFSRIVLRWRGRGDPSRDAGGGKGYGPADRGHRLLGARRPDPCGPGRRRSRLDRQQALHGVDRLELFLGVAGRRQSCGAADARTDGPAQDRGRRQNRPVRTGGGARSVRLPCPRAIPGGCAPHRHWRPPRRAERLLPSAVSTPRTQRSPACRIRDTRVPVRIWAPSSLASRVNARGTDAVPPSGYQTPSLVCMWAMPQSTAGDRSGAEPTYWVK